MKNILIASFFACALLACSPSDTSTKNSKFDQAEPTAPSNKTPLPLEKYFESKMFTLDNGLRVVLHKDETIPFVDIALYFHVGSKDEPEGKSGFAHLFEHLLFNGTPKAPGEYFEHLDEIGGAGANGSTTRDYTNYYETVPNSSLEAVLWLEADRMANILDGVTKTKVQTQIDVVKNEKGLSENEPFGISYETTLKALFPKGHPYHHSTIGSIEDLESASLDDVKDWFEKYYGAKNAVLSLAGDIDYDEAEALIRKHFSHIRPGPTLTQISTLPVKRTTNTRHIVREKAPQSSLERVYTFPPVNSFESAMTLFAANILTDGDYSLLNRELVETKKLATYVHGRAEYDALASTFTIYVEPADGISLETLTSALDEVVENYLDAGPNEEDIQRLASKNEAFLRGITGQNSSKSQMLAEGLMLHGEPLRWLEELTWAKDATPELLKVAANKWFSEGYHESYHIAEDELTATPSNLVPAVRPEIGKSPELDMPEPIVYTLSNGLKVVHVERATTPNIEMALVFPIGQKTIAETEIETASMALDLMTYAGRGQESRSDVEARKDKLGISTSSYLNDFYSVARLRATASNLDVSLDVLTEEIISPQYLETDVNREIKLRKIDREQSLKRPESVAEHIASVRILGNFHAYSDREALDALKTIKPSKLAAFHSEWIKPDGATLYVVGDVSVEDLKSKLESRFQNWTGSANWPGIKVGDLPVQSTPTFILIEKKNTTQTELSLTRVTDIGYEEDPLSFKVANKIFSGSFTSRLNLNIREDKGWSYRIGSNASIEPNYSTWQLNSSVTRDVTLDAVREIINEIEAIRTDNPITANEIEKSISADVKSMAYWSGDATSLLRTFIGNDRKGQPYDYKETEQERLEALTADQVNVAIKRLMNTDDLVWTLVGEISTFETELRAANLGAIEVYDLRGNRLR